MGDINKTNIHDYGVCKNRQNNIKILWQKIIWCINNIFEENPNIFKEINQRTVANLKRVVDWNNLQ